MSGRAVARSFALAASFSRPPAVPSAAPALHLVVLGCCSSRRKLPEPMLAYVASESPFPARPRALALGRACSHASARMDGVEVWSSPLVCSLLKFPHLGEALGKGEWRERGGPRPGKAAEDLRRELLGQEPRRCSMSGATAPAPRPAAKAPHGFADGGKAANRPSKEECGDLEEILPVNAGRLKMYEVGKQIGTGKFSVSACACLTGLVVSN